MSVVLISQPAWAIGPIVRTRFFGKAGSMAGRQWTRSVRLRSSLLRRHSAAISTLKTANHVFGPIPSEERSPLRILTALNNDLAAPGGAAHMQDSYIRKRLENVVMNSSPSEPVATGLSYRLEGMPYVNAGRYKPLRDELYKSKHLFSEDGKPDWMNPQFRNHATPMEHVTNVIFYSVSAAAAGHIIYQSVNAALSSGIGFSAAYGPVAGALAFASPFGLLALAGAGAYFTAGLYIAHHHFLFDEYFDANTPIVGRQAASFKYHHPFPNNLTKWSFATTVAAPIRGAIIPMALSLAFAPNVFIEAFALFAFNWIAHSQQIHKWAHMEDPPPYAVWAQEKGFIQGPEHLKHHHILPNADYYDATHGKWDPWLSKIGYWQKLRRLIYRTTGARPDSWNLEPGLQAEALGDIPRMSLGDWKRFNRAVLYDPTFGFFLIG